jgi:cell division cycle protein 20 (cofactor of APC complex)
VVYLWESSSGSITELVNLEAGGDAAGDAYVSSVKFTRDGEHIAVGRSDNLVELWNIQKQRRLSSLDGHAARVGALAWNKHILTTGGRDGLIVNHDVRQADHKVATLRAHTLEVCGLAWSPDGTMLASGGNDNLCCISEAGRSAPRHRITEHTSAVKAMAWCPFQSHLLATGGGSADRHIRFFNSVTGAQMSCVDTQSQVTALVWSPHEKELLSAHGMNKNQLTLWRYPSMSKVTDLSGHSARILQCCLSADGTTVVSCGADETLRFWKVWEPQECKGSAKPARLQRTSSALSTNIR